MLEAPIRDEEEVSRVEKRIWVGEAFLRKLKSLSGEELINQFPLLEEEYKNEKIKTSKFEQLLQIKEREEYFVKNIEMILQEEGYNSDKIKELRVKVTFIRN